jgi:hypothetical protein
LILRRLVLRRLILRRLTLRASRYRNQHPSKKKRYKSSTSHLTNILRLSCP